MQCTFNNCLSDLSEAVLSIHQAASDLSLPLISLNQLLFTNLQAVDWLAADRANVTFMWGGQPQHQQGKCHFYMREQPQHQQGKCQFYMREHTVLWDTSKMDKRQFHWSTISIQPLKTECSCPRGQGIKKGIIQFIQQWVYYLQKERNAEIKHTVLQAQFVEYPVNRCHRVWNNQSTCLTQCEITSQHVSHSMEYPVNMCHTVWNNQST